MRTWVWEMALSVTVGLAIPASARALGALPVFAFLTLPASAALLLRVRLGQAFALAAAFGVVASAAGYLVSWFGETPTGATMVAVAALFLVPTGMVSVWSGAIDDGYAGMLGWFWGACVVTTIGLVITTLAALKERQYSAVMAATGLLYLAILTGFGIDLVARATLS